MTGEHGVMPGEHPGFPDVFVVLTGGRGTRLGGRDKASLPFDGVTALQRALTTIGTVPTVVVGPHAPSASHIVVTREDPPLGGPAAGVAAAVAVLTGPLPWRDMRPLPDDAFVAIWAVDQVGVTAETWRRLVASATAASAVPGACRAPASSDDHREAHGAVLTSDGRQQVGVVAARWGALRRGCATRNSWHDAPLRQLIEYVQPVSVPGNVTEARDIDTLKDLRWWQHHFEDLGRQHPRKSQQPDEGTTDDDADDG